MYSLFGLSTYQHPTNICWLLPNDSLILQNILEAEETDNEDEEENEGDELEVYEEPEASQDTRGSLLPEESEASEVPESEPEAG